MKDYICWARDVFPVMIHWPSAGRMTQLVLICCCFVKHTAFFCWLWETCNLDRECMINSYRPAFFLLPGHSFHVAVLLFQSSAVLSCHKMLLALSRTHNKQLGLIKSQCKLNQTWKKVILVSLWSTASLVYIMKTCKTLPSYCRN